MAVSTADIGNVRQKSYAHRASAGHGQSIHTMLNNTSCEPTYGMVVRRMRTTEEKHPSPWNGMTECKERMIQR